MVVPSQKKFLEELSGTCYARSTHYRYNKHNLFTEKYGKGRLAAYDYIGQLCYYFIQEEKSIPARLKEQIEGQMEKYSCLSDSDYKKGMYDALEEMIEFITSEKK